MENSLGKIVSIACKDFITYDVMKYFPGDYLNIIIGPNGTGKSTIVAAIVLGMGGNCKLLSRSKDISDFVKNGKNIAHIEIELKRDRETVTFHRSFDKNSKEQFLIDGTKVSSKEYLRRAREFNVQIDNLCQFLPQDRVQDFTKMNPQELLKNTQISVCPQEIIDAFQKLIQKRDEQKNVSKVNADNLIKLKDAEERNEQLKSQIENINTKNKLLEKYNLCVKKKSWMEYDDEYKKLKDCEADRDKMSDLVKKKTSDIKPLQIQANKINAVKSKLKENISETNSKTTSSSNELDKLIEATEKGENDVNRAKRDLQDIISAANDRETDINEARVVLNVYHQDLEDLKRAVEAEGNNPEKINEIKQQIEDIQRANEKLLEKRSSVSRVLEDKIIPAINSSERKIQSIANIGKQRLDKLRTNFEDAYKAYEWLQQNMDQFEGHVYAPILLEINVKDKKNAKYIENTIAYRDFISFTCTEKRDIGKLVKKLRNDMGLSVNVAYVAPFEEIRYHPRFDIESLAPLGFHSYLLDMIEGPTPILNYLCQLYQLHEIPVGNDKTYKEVSKVPAEIRRFFTTNHRFASSISKYSGSRNTLSSQISDHNLLNAAVDMAQLETEKQNFKRLKQEADLKRNIRNQIENEIKKNEVEIQDLKMEIKRSQEKIGQLRQCQDKMRKKEMELKKLMDKSYDIEGEKQKFKHKVDSLVANMMKLQQAKIGCLEKYKAAVISKMICQKKMSVFDESNAEIEEQIRAAQEEVRKLTETLNKIQVSFDQVKQKCKDKQAAAKALTNNLTPNAPGFPYTKKFVQLPDALDELQAKMDELQGRIDCIQGADQGIFEEFENRKKFIDELKETIRNSHLSAENIERTLQELHEKWYPAIKSVVDEINKNFSNFMRMMGFVGEVEIIHKEERDYNDYGIQIRVQYRDNERLQPLSRHVQSGGERAVAIAVYTMSLQHITKVPFRCVDEINQGMDPKNERKIFEMLVKLTCREGQSQYFFVTPKLLPNLPCSDLMTVSVVHNGKHISDPYIFNDIDD